MHVLLIHQAFATGDEKGATRHYDLCRDLMDQGWDVTVVASTINYLTDKKISTEKNIILTGKDGGKMTICRSWAYAGLHKNYFTKLLSFLSFMLSSFWKALGIKKVDVVWGSSPSLLQAFTACLVAWIKRVPFVFEVRDLWPDCAIQLGALKNKALIALSRSVERFLYKHAHHIIVNSPGFIPYLLNKGAQAEQISIVLAGVDINAFDPNNRGEAIKKEFGLEKKFVVIYAGTHGDSHGLHDFIAAAKTLSCHEDMAFVLVGDGRAKASLIKQAEDMALTNVRFIPAQSKKRVPDFLAAADVCVAMLKRIPMYTINYPQKIIDYMAAGKPTILAIDGVMRDLMRSADAGAFVKPGDSEGLAKTIYAYYNDRGLCERQGRNARAYVIAHFDRRQQSIILKTAFEKTLAGRKL